MERVLYSKFSDDRKKKYCIRTDIVEKDGVKKVKKVPLYKEGITHIAYINKIYGLLCQEYKDIDVAFNKCEIENDAIYLEYIPHKTLQMLMEEYIDEDNEAAIEKILYRYVHAIQEECDKHEFIKTDEFIEVFGDVNIPDGYMSLKVTDIDLIFSNIMTGKKWEVIDYEWTFTFPIPVKYVIYRAFFLAHHQMRKCHILELENLMSIANISIQEQAIFRKMEENFQKYIAGDATPFRDIILSTGKTRTTMGEEFSRRDQDIIKRDQEIIKRDQEIIKRDQEIIKRDQEIVKRDQEILKLIELNQQAAQNLSVLKKEFDTCREQNAEVIHKKDEQILQLLGQIEEIEETKWWKARTALMRIIRK